MGDQDKTKKQLITERKQAERRFQELFEEAPVMYVISRNQGGVPIVTECNKLFLKTLGYTIGEVLNRPLADFYTPESRAKLLKGGFQRALKGDFIDEERELVAAEGHIVRTLLRAVPERDSEGRVCGTRAMYVDISDRKKAEKAVQDSEQKYRTIIETMSEGLLQVDNNGVIQFVNNRFCEMTGYSRVELLDSSAHEMLLSEKHQGLMKEKIELRMQGISDQYDIQLKKKSGETIWVRISGTPVFDDDGKVIGSIGIHTDITERKRAERKLQTSEERFRDLFNNAPDIYIIMDSNGTVIDINQRCLSQLGYKTNEIVGTPISNYIHPDDLANAGRVMSYIQRTGEPPKNIELRLIHKSGQPLWVSTEFALFKTNEGNVQSIRVVCRDITKRKRLQQELARAQRLETAGKVAGQIAHDLNNLLAPLTAYPALVRDDLDANHPVLAMLDEMESAANKIAEINQQLLALGRRGHYNMEPTNLNDLIENMVLDQRFPKNIVVREELTPDLLMIKAGGTQLTRALNNLINNAVESIHDTGTLTVKTENVYLDEAINGYQTITRGEYVKLEISDTGMGIEPEILDKIFDPFFTTKKMDWIRGSGLGLSVVNGIVQDHKGYITVESTLGQGTTFSLYFPVIRELAGEITETVQKYKGGNERILVVDDDPVQQRVACQILGRLGYTVHTVSSGEEAVTFVQKYPQDLLVLDMVMDGIDGVETYRQILEIEPAQYAIILSGYAMSHRVKQAQRLGAGLFVSKPVAANILATAVRKELDKKKKRRSAK
jgi:PAS domain S-box-containing protein